MPLFHRHARGLILTEQGELLYRTAHEVFGKLAMTEAQLTESKDRPKGPLKITTTVASVAESAERTNQRVGQAVSSVEEVEAMSSCPLPGLR